MGCVVNTTPRRLYPRKKELVPVVQEHIWPTVPVWTVTLNFAPPPPSQTRREQRTTHSVVSRYTDWVIPAASRHIS
jgi:hypothetical protein